MYKNLKRILSLALTLTLVVGMLSVITVSAAEENRGTAFTAGKDTYFYLDQPGEWKYISFEYKTEGAGELAVILRGSQWSKYHGDFRLTESGEKVDYDGVTTEPLDDGYIRATFELELLQRSGCVNNRDTAPVDIKLIDIFQWTTVGGYIDNIQVYNNPAELIVRGQEFAAGGNNFYYLAQSGAWNYVSFDYKLKGSGELAAILRGSSWTKYYGDFRLTKEGEKIDYAGITTEKLEDGYIHVIFDIAQLTRTACMDNRNDAPEDIALIDIFGAWTTVNGYIDNIQWSANVHTHTFENGQCVDCGALESYNWTLTADATVDMLLEDDLYVDLNGFSLTGTLDTNGFKIYGIDSATNAYSCDNMGIFSCVDAEGNVIVPEKFYNSDDAKYMTLAGEDGYSFHRYYVGITTVSLAPNDTGFGYKAEFYGDEAVQTQVVSVGYDLWLDGGRTVSRTTEFKNVVTLRLKNFDAVNYGNTPVNARATMILVDGTVLEGSVHSWSLQQMVEAVNAAYTDYSAEKLAAVKVMIEANPVMLDWQVENLLKEETAPRGQKFTAGKDNYFTFEAGAWDVMTFDYKTEGTGEVAVIVRGTTWTKFYGDFRLTQDGEKVDYDGITTEVLEDGYIHVTMDIALLGRTNCVNDRNNAPEDIALIDIYQWTTVDGYIDNIQVSMKPEEEVVRGEAFEAGVTKTKYMDTVAQNNLTFDYKLTSEGDMHVILRAPDWAGFYGDFEFTANGEAVDYDGITTELLEDGYIRATVVFSKLNRTGCVNNRDSAPASVGIFDIYSWGTANGYVDNIQVDVEIEEVPEIPAVPAETTSFTAGTGVSAGIPTAYQTVTFDYQLTGDGVIGVILRDAEAWLKYYGEFYFNAGGETIDYAGITTQDLGNGYIRVTMNLAELTRSGCVDNRNSAPEKVGVLDIYGAFSTASGNFGNVTVDP